MTTECRVSRQTASRSGGRPRPPSRGVEPRPLCNVKRIPFLLIALFALSACHREKRDLQVTAAEASRSHPIRESTLQPGSKALAATAMKNPYENNAYAISQGQQLFSQMNCAGCHFHGGGGIGPALMDEEWVYGSDPANIYESISEGRPNGMPSFGGHLTNAQIWQLTTYVRALGGLEQQPAAQPRADEMQARRAEEPK